MRFMNWLPAWLLPVIIGACTLSANAQPASLEREMVIIRNLRGADRVFDASDKAVRQAVRQPLDRIDDPGAKEALLWEIADIHLQAANKWAATKENQYAKRAIDAWIEYVEFAVDQNMPKRLHRGVDYLQRSYIQADQHPAMFSRLLQLPAKYVNDKVMTRWEDRLRACSDFSRGTGLSWVEAECRKAECKESVSGFYEYARRWLGEFPLKDEPRIEITQRLQRVPASCRTP